MIALVIAFFTVCSFSSIAADIPADVQGAQAYSKMRCITETTQTCINDKCLTSDNRDCQSDCSNMAQSKCAQQSD